MCNWTQCLMLTNDSLIWRDATDWEFQQFADSPTVSIRLRSLISTRIFYMYATYNNVHPNTITWFFDHISNCFYKTQKAFKKSLFITKIKNIQWSVLFWVPLIVTVQIIFWEAMPCIYIYITFSGKRAASIFWVDQRIGTKGIHQPKVKFSILMYTS